MASRPPARSRTAAGRAATTTPGTRPWVRVRPDDHSAAQHRLVRYQAGGRHRRDLRGRGGRPGGRHHRLALRRRYVPGAGGSAGPGEGDDADGQGDGNGVAEGGRRRPKNGQVLTCGCSPARKSARQRQSSRPARSSAASVRPSSRPDLQYCSTSVVHTQASGGVMPPGSPTPWAAHSSQRPEKALTRGL